jgi:pimeloyl-ACP methyl ester carboxylesterase
MSAPTAGRVDLGGVTLHLRRCGEGPALFFLHGFPDHGGCFAAMMAGLSDDRTCLAPDQRGHGLSDAPAGVESYGLDALADDVATLATKLGHARFDVVAHDWGGLVAWHLAGRHPGRVGALVVFNAPHPACLAAALESDADQAARSSYVARLRDPDAAARLTAMGPAAAWETFFGEDFRAGRLTPEARAEGITVLARPGIWRSMTDWYRAAPFLVEGARGACPTRFVPTDRRALLIWGEADPLFGPAALVGMDVWAPNAAILRVPDGGHAVFRERPAWAMEVTRAFLSGAEGAGPT